VAWVASSRYSSPETSRARGTAGPPAGCWETPRGQNEQCVCCHVLPADRMLYSARLHSRTMNVTGVRGRGLGIRKERSIAPLVLLAAQALAQRVVPLTRNSFKTLVTFTPCALSLTALPKWSGQALVYSSIPLCQRGTSPRQVVGRPLRDMQSCLLRVSAYAPSEGGPPNGATVGPSPPIGPRSVTSR
jgi:hypothetical protein